MQIYLARNQVQAGPYTLTELNNMLASGQVLLNDLMWHEGMQQWQLIGDVTNGKLHYDPDGSNTTTTPNKRVTVAELYGQKPTESDVFTSTPDSSDNKTQPIVIIKKSNLAAKTDVVLAKFIQRFIALMINILLFSFTLIPISSNMDPEVAFSFLQDNVDQVTVINTIVDITPQHLLIMTACLFVALLFVQAILLVKRGQSLGKLIMGIRILNANTKQLASTNVVLIRAILTTVFYFFTPIGFLIMIADFISMMINPNKQTLHDKIAKTIIVEANPDQLENK